MFYTYPYFIPIGIPNKIKTYLILATQGYDLVEAMSMAEEACSMYLFTSLKDGEVFPHPMPINEVEKDEENAFVNLLLVDLEGYAKKYNDKAVKKH